MSTGKPIRLPPDRIKAFRKTIPLIPQPNVVNNHAANSDCDEPLELVYNIRYSIFRLAPASQLLTSPPPNHHHKAPEKTAKNPGTLLSPTIDSAPLLNSTAVDHPRQNQNLESIAASLQPHKIMKEVIKSPPQKCPSTSKFASISMAASKPGRRSQTSSSLRTKSKGMEATDNCKVQKPHLEIPGNLPPVLVDGKMLIVELPRWKRKIDFCWRTSDGSKSKVLIREVALPLWVWLGTNGPRRRWTELWIERG